MEDIAERFIEEESAHRMPGVDPLDRARFHRLVRQCAANWLLHNRSGLRITRGKQGMTLHFDGPVGGKVLSIFSLRASHRAGEYRFTGPNADRSRMGFGKDHLAALDRLRDLYEAVLSGPDGDQRGADTISAVILGRRTPDVVPLVEETRRVLDGGSEGGGGGERSARPARRKKAEKPDAPPRETPARAPTPRRAAPPPENDGSQAVVARVTLTSPDPQKSAAFFGRLLKTKAETAKDGTATLRLGSVVLEIAGELSKEDRRLLGYGSVAKNRGWGTRMRLNVRDFDLCLRRARRMGDVVISEAREQRTFLVRDPAGHVLEIGE